ncbi:hypothetical protein C8J30_11386 [Rhodobacter viridis]|uniref:Integrase catalytic domain-containing protein n=1 Tax=Rhodobacter viridis TaxID=1054202 RepID=A0A318TWU7_9RHOB|nr:hypothetical protein [Rhodobacter viridis]PYF08227.1 hypothetical protein C8J30_11386 [Rhodobacter viridis]
MLPSFIDSTTLAELAQISKQAARRAIAKGEIQGHPLQVTTIEGTRSHGGYMHIVSSSSLPAHLRQRLHDLAAEGIAPEGLRIDATGLAEHNWKLDVIRPILGTARGSSARAGEYRRLIGTTRIDWTGTPRHLTKSTLYDWVETFERCGGRHLCLAKKPRNDKGQRRVFVSREWEKAVSFDQATREQVHEDLKQYMRSLIKGGAQRKIALTLTGEKLRQITLAYGVELADRKTWAIPLDFYREEQRFKAVYRHKTDRKASEDNKPRIRRTTANLAPMEVVVMDVHHINVLVQRDNGTTATPKLIAFHDIATNRVFCEIILFEERGGVRNADVIEAFINMCQDPSFGVPGTLYADNGAEYGFADDLADALQLNCSVIGFNGSEDRNRVIRAKPYNAAAKHVEGWFRQMNQQYFRHIKGWIDDDRMNPKSPEVGKKAPPFDDGWDTFQDTIYGLLTAYENIPQKSGSLNNISPAAAFKKHVEAGWKATLMNPQDLLTLFTRPETRDVRKHCVEVFGQYWTCDGLLSCFDRKVIVHIPRYHGFSALRITDERGHEIGIAHADRPYEVLDERGAKESARRSSVRNRALTTLGKSVPTIDVGKELMSFGHRQEPVTPNNPDAVISVNRRGGKGLALSPTPAPKGKTRQQEEDEARQLMDALEAALPSKTRKAS